MIPCMEKVLPDPVGPYAKTAPFTPSKELSNDAAGALLKHVALRCVGVEYAIEFKLEAAADAALGSHEVALLSYAHLRLDDNRLLKASNHRFDLRDGRFQSRQRPHPHGDVNRLKFRLFVTHFSL